MNLSIIIVSWNVGEKLRENLRAIFNSENGDFSYEVFVIDNNSRDGTIEMISAEFPQVKLIANQENFGFARACNQGIRIARGDYILLLNPDMRIFPETLKNMVGWMDNHKEAAIAGCRLINEKGETIKQARRFPTIWDQLAIVLKLPHLSSGILNKYLQVNFDYSQAVKVDSIRGGFFMMREEAIDKIGLLDEQFFLWFEEVDYCRRAKEAGLEVWYTPVAECVDYVGQSFKQVKRGVTQKYFRDSMLKYFKKWQPLWQYYLLKIAWPFGIFLTWAGELGGFKARAKT
jgi:GT2 family glycosyltransferase